MRQPDCWAGERSSGAGRQRRDANRDRERRRETLSENSFSASIANARRSPESDAICERCNLSDTGAPTKGIRNERALERIKHSFGQQNTFGLFHYRASRTAGMAAYRLTALSNFNHADASATHSPDEPAPMWSIALPKERSFVSRNRG